MIWSLSCSIIILITNAQQIPACQCFIVSLVRSHRTQSDFSCFLSMESLQQFLVTVMLLLFRENILKCFWKTENNLVDELRVTFNSKLNDFKLTLKKLKQQNEKHLDRGKKKTEIKTVNHSENSVLNVFLTYLFVFQIIDRKKHQHRERCCGGNTLSSGLIWFYTDIVLQTSVVLLCCWVCR